MIVLGSATCWCCYVLVLQRMFSSLESSFGRCIEFVVFVNTAASDALKIKE